MRLSQVQVGIAACRITDELLDIGENEGIRGYVGQGVLK